MRIETLTRRRRLEPLPTVWVQLQGTFAGLRATPMVAQGCDEPSVHDIGTVAAPAPVLAAPRRAGMIEYVEVPSGIVVHAVLTVSVVAVLEEIVRVWPAPVPPVIVTLRTANWFVAQDLVLSMRVVEVCAPFAVPVSLADDAFHCSVRPAPAAAVTSVIAANVSWTIWPAPLATLTEGAVLVPKALTAVPSGVV